MLTIGADSTGVVGKMSRYLRNNWGKSIFLPRYYFATATVLTLLSYNKILKIAAVRSFSQLKWFRGLEPARRPSPDS